MEGPALVIAPVSVGAIWAQEIQRFCPGLRPVLYRETDRFAKRPRFRKADVVIASYGLARLDIDRLASVRWHSLVLDEAQFIKNPRTKAARAVRRLEARWRFALTGTPLENHLGELWGIFPAVCPGLFGSWERFREQFALPIERDSDEARRQQLVRVL